jgi:Lon protease-like protein
MSMPAEVAANTRWPSVLVARLDPVDAVQDLAAVAPAGAVAEAACLEQDDAAVRIALAQVPGRRHAGDAAADDATSAVHSPRRAGRRS